jgi:hypothetical protein
VGTRRALARLALEVVAVPVALVVRLQLVHGLEHNVGGGLTRALPLHRVLRAAQGVPACSSQESWHLAALPNGERTGARVCSADVAGDGRRRTQQAESAPRAQIRTRCSRGILVVTCAASGCVPARIKSSFQKDERARESNESCFPASRVLTCRCKSARRWLRARRR